MRVSERSLPDSAIIGATRFPDNAGSLLYFSLTISCTLLFVLSLVAKEASAGDCRAPVTIDSRCMGWDVTADDCPPYRTDDAGRVIWPVDGVPDAWTCQSGTPPYFFLLCPGASTWIGAVDEDKLTAYALHNCSNSAATSRGRSYCNARTADPGGWGKFLLDDVVTTNNGICLKGTSTRRNAFLIGSTNAGWKYQGAWCEPGELNFWPNGMIKTCKTARVWLETAPSGKACSAGHRVWLDSNGNMERCDD